MKLHVEIDALVFLKIEKHCREQLPVLVTGQLLGLDSSVKSEDSCCDKLSITNCFPFLTKSGDEMVADDEEVMAYQAEMTNQLSRSLLDDNTIGWYSCTIGDSYLTDVTLLDTQFGYQETVERSVVIVYDPLAASSNKVPFKVLRVVDEYMALRTEAQLSRRPVDLTEWPAGKNFLEEVPFTVVNTLFVDAFLVNYILPTMKKNEVEEILDSSRLANPNTVMERATQNIYSLLDLAENEQRAISACNRRLASAGVGSRDVRRHRDDLTFECAQRTLEAKLLCARIGNKI